MSTSWSHAKEVFRSKADATKEAVHNSAEAVKRRVLEESLLASEGLKQEVIRAKDRAIESAENVARDVLCGLEKLESEIANHYLDGMKYGMAGASFPTLLHYILVYSVVQVLY
jgi:hypothetical protein